MANENEKPTPASGERPSVLHLMFNNSKKSLCGLRFNPAPWYSWDISDAAMGQKIKLELFRSVRYCKSCLPANRVIIKTGNMLIAIKEKS